MQINAGKTDLVLGAQERHPDNGTWRVVTDARTKVPLGRIGRTSFGSWVVLAVWNGTGYAALPRSFDSELAALVGMVDALVLPAFD